MAVQNTDGKYVGANGSVHDNLANAEASFARMSGATNAVASGLMGNLGSMAIWAMLGALIALIILIIAAGLRGGWILAKALPLYPLAILAAIVAWAMVKSFLRIPLKGLLALVAAAAVGYFGWKGATSYYNNSNRVFPSTYSADYIVGTQKMHEKRNQRGAEYSLSADEKVTVNGISFNLQEFNITTADGKTGWVAREAFPDDADEMLYLSVGLDGVDAWEIGRDRQTERLMGRFYDIEQTGGGKDPISGYDMVEHKNFTLKPDALGRFTRVGTQAPIVYLTPKAAKNGEQWVDNGTKITLYGVAYEPDCTVIALTIIPGEVVKDKNVPYIWLAEGGKRNSPAWKSSLTVTDLATGDTWRTLPADYTDAYTSEGSVEKRKYTQLFFFPPFSSHRFSLTHGGVSPLPDGKTKSGYGGILGLLSSGTSMSGENSKFYFDWNFGEVNVK